MSLKAVIVVGAGLGYILGTRNGRQQLDKITTWTQDRWADPRVQAQVNDLGAKVTEFARTEGANIKDKVTEFARTEGSTLKETVTGTVQYVVGSFAASGGPAQVG